MGVEQSLGCRCLEAAKSAACRELKGPCLPLPRAVQSSAGSADAQVPALLLPVLPVHHTLTGACNYAELGSGIWGVAGWLQQKGILGGWILPAFGGRGQCLHSLAFSSIPQLWSREKADTSRIFCPP